jgi:hypothetical protein
MKSNWLIPFQRNKAIYEYIIAVNDETNNSLNVPVSDGHRKNIDVSLTFHTLLGRLQTTISAGVQPNTVCHSDAMSQ